MRYALSGSVLVHIGAVLGSYVFLAWPEPSQPTPLNAVTVDLIEVGAVVTNETTIVRSDALESMTAAGSIAASPNESRVIERALPDNPIVSAADSLKPATGQEQVETAETEPLNEISPQPVEPIAPIEVASIETSSPQQLTSAILEPQSESFLPIAPMPKTLSKKRTSKPTSPPKKAKQTQNEKASPSRQASLAGDGGKQEATAKVTSGGASAALRNYPGKVQSRLRRALRYPSGARRAQGAVYVEFTVSANGNASGIRIIRSSGNPALDNAALATVQRASPFPPIPDDAGRSSWLFSVPLTFRPN